MYSEKLINTLKNGGVAVISTDTILGLVSVAEMPEAVSRVYDLKDRAPEKPFIILISDVASLSRFGVILNTFQKNFLKESWPGPVSIILPVEDKKFDYLTRGTHSLAFRMPEEKGLRDLIEVVGPLVAPSANPKGLPPAKNAAEAYKYFEKKVDCYDVSENSSDSTPSTLVMLAEDHYRVVRPGRKKI